MVDDTTRLIQFPGPVQMALVEVTTDSVAIEASWSAAVDPSGIDRYDWKNWRTTADTVVASGTTTLQVDTLSLEKPPINTRWEYGFEIRAVDTKGNEGPYSLPFRYAVVHEDQVGPVPPDTIYLDTLIVVGAVQAIAVWPESVEVDSGQSVQLYAAVLYSDGSISCDVPPAAPGALYESGTFTGGCDSAIARLP